MKARSFGILLLILPPALLAQTQPNLENGCKPHGSYHGSDIDSVNLMNGNLHLHIPLPFSYGQRGNLNRSMWIQSVAKTWNIVPTGSGNTAGYAWKPTWLGSSTAGPPRVTTTFDLKVHRIWQSDTPYGGGTSYEITCNQTARVTSVTDVNGNIFNVGADGSGLDTVGRTSTASASTTDYSGCAGGTTGASLYTFPAIGGGSALLKLCLISVALATNFNVTGVSEFGGYVYDAWGNLQHKNVTKCSAETLNVVAQTNNRLSGYSYDPAGNMVNDSFHSYSFNADGQMTSVDNGAASYLYGANGERAYKNAAGGSTEYFYFGGDVMAEKNISTGNWTDYVFFNGKRVARRDANGSVHYYLGDHLGSTSMVISSSGTVENESEFYPWGGELRFQTSDSGNHYKFTGKERDAESSLDYFGARYYSSVMGRWVSADWSAVPAPVPYADFADPQSLNLYGYVRNLPTTRVDKDGHCSAPKLEKGQTGICVDTYIKAPILPPKIPVPAVGLGDNRGPAPNDPSKSYRQEIQIVITPGKDPAKVKDAGGVSTAITPIGPIKGQGTSQTTISTGATDKDGTQHFNVSSTGLNGLASLPGAPKDAIQTSINFSATADGRVGLDPGGMRTAYPSIEIYAYGADGSVRTIYQRTESGNPDDLKRQDQPIPKVDPK